MVFSSPLFILVFLPLFLAVYWYSPVQWKNSVALIGSFVFYSWGAPAFAWLLLVSGLLDYLVSAKLRTSQGRYWLWLALIYNTGLLFVFKYFNFFEDNFRHLFNLLGMQFSPWMKVALPIGISFFTFQKVSYVVDVYRGTANKARSAVDYLLFVFLFPQLIAGPIIRYHELEAQIADRTAQEHWHGRLSGWLRFTVGLAKKVLIADALAPVADSAFAHPDPATAWMGLLAYAIQIYIDFSGYSDMAIGLGQMMGFVFPENFCWPYQAAGFREFWQRWHMTLGNFMREYLYIPLGGSYRGHWITARNLWTVFLLSGLWHGASWHFVLWGAWHGLFITIDRRTQLFHILPTTLSVLLTFVLVVLGWVWFRALSVSDALAYFHALGEMELHQSPVKPVVATAISVALVFSFLPHQLFEQMQRVYRAENQLFDILKTGASLALLALSLGAIGLSQGQPFIYFHF